MACNVVFTRGQAVDRQHRRQRCWNYHHRPCPRFRCNWPPNDLHDLCYRRQVSNLQQLQQLLFSNDTLQAFRLITNTAMLNKMWRRKQRNNRRLMMSLSRRPITRNPRLNRDLIILLLDAPSQPLHLHVSQLHHVFGTQLGFADVRRIISSNMWTTGIEIVKCFENLYSPETGSEKKK